ncbi:hypothetical protein D3C87_1046450 [compost metagenome]
MNKNSLSIFEVYPTLAPKEYAVLHDISVSEAKIILEELHSKGKLDKKAIKNGTLYIKK